jgi:DNA repair protein RecO (recombination protein O)
VEDAFMNLDAAPPGVTANYPIYFALHLAYFFGFRLHDNYSEQRQILDLQNGSFTEQPPAHMHYTHEEYSFVISQFLKAQRPEELLEIKLNKKVRREILLALQSYYAFHIAEFGRLKTLPILQAIVAEL